MDLFDKLFNKKENKIDKAMEDAYQNFVENNPIMKKAKEKINEAADSITYSLEDELYGGTRSKPGDHGDILEHYEERSRYWDRMIEGIKDKELSQYKICTECGQAASADLETCPYCNAKLPEHTADVQICPHCGAKNKALDFYCVNCGKELVLIPEAEEKK